MVRNKANLILKDKGRAGKAKGFLPIQNFPLQEQYEYHNCRILLGTKDFEKELLQKDLNTLKEDFKLHTSSSEYDKIPYIQEAIDYSTKELTKPLEEIQEETEELDF